VTLLLALDPRFRWFAVLPAAEDPTFVWLQAVDDAAPESFESGDGAPSEPPHPAPARDTDATTQAHETFDVRKGMRDPSS
jgi:hypothetical protein